jgi:hypothetical protein
MSLKKFALYKLVLLALVMVSVVLSYIPDLPYHVPTADTGKQNFHVIEFDDHGELHLPEQWQGLQQRITQTNEGSAPELVIFIHGWHQSAKPTDENFLSFQRFYQQMAVNDPQRNLLGLYIGWRGDKYDPLFLDGSTDANSKVEPLDFPTIYQRKTVAKRIGQHGMSQLLDQLDLLVEQRKLQRYVLIGHSLGGAMALHASKDRIKTAIERQQDNPNLFILLNPAVNAREYRPLDSLLSIDRQKPSMVVLQSKGDFALKEAFNWLKDGERAVGNSWAITHDIDKCPSGNCQTPIKMPESLLVHDQTPGCMMTLERSGWKVRARLQARRTVQSCPDANMQAVWVLAVSDEIINGHNGILTPDHGTALSEVMSLIDLYRNQLPADAVKQARQLRMLEQQAEAQLSAVALDETSETVIEPQQTEQQLAEPTLTEQMSAELDSR